MNRYVVEFFKLTCAGDLLNFKLFPNVKEVTESMAAFNGIRDYIMKDRFDYKSDNVVVISVGDGNTPRTAAMCAMRSNWECISIDPIMKTTDYNIKRLKIYKNKVEELDLNFPDKIVVILCVHSHAKLNDILGHIHGKERHLLTIPCCVPHEIKNVPYLGYMDSNIDSEKKHVKIWMGI